MVSLFELDPPPSIKARPRSRSRVIRHANPELHAIREQHGPEGEGVWTYGRDEESGDFGVYEGAAGGELHRIVVRCGKRGREKKGWRGSGERTY